MALVVPNVQEVIAIQAWIDAAQPWELKLFGNDVTPISSSVAGDFTEPSNGGYSSISLSGSWTVTPGGPSYATYAQQSFTFSGAIDPPETLYGYFIVDADGVLVMAERLPSPPYGPTNNGDVIKVTPKITLGSEFED